MVSIYVTCFLKNNFTMTPKIIGMNTTCTIDKNKAPGDTGNQEF